MTKAYKKLILLIFFILSAAFAPGHEPARGAGKEAPGAPEGMVFVKGGCFEMGDPFPQIKFPDGDPDEKPLHTVCVDDYYIGKHEVTVGEFKEFTASTGYRAESERGAGCVIIFGGRVWRHDPGLSWRNPSFDQTDAHPVVCVSWNDANEYVKWKSAVTGKLYRLPTEAEWEYAARGRGKVYKWSWGNGGPSGNIADESLKRAFPELYPEKTYWKGYDDGYVFTSPAGSFRPNDLGIYDMSGSVWEMTGDWYDVDYYKKSPRDNPKGSLTDNTRVRKGGSWTDDDRHQRIANRSKTNMDRSRFDMGFRVVLDPDGK